MAKKKYVHTATLRRRVYNCLKDFPCEYTKEDVLSCIDRVPAADVEPVQYGKWEYDATHDVFSCTVCKTETYSASNFCPNCGTKMDLESEDK